MFEKTPYIVLIPSIKYKQKKKYCLIGLKYILRYSFRNELLPSNTPNVSLITCSRKEELIACLKDNIFSYYSLKFKALYFSSPFITKALLQLGSAKSFFVVITQIYGFLVRFIYAFLRTL